MKRTKNLLRDLKRYYKEVKVNEQLKNHTSFRIGGAAKILLFPTTLEQIVQTFLIIKEYEQKYYILGNATNVLASDEGFDGIVISLKKFTGIERHGMCLEAWAGTSLSEVVNFANLNGLGGLEEGFGIPGSCGGAVIMNASAFGFETGKVVGGVLALVDGKIAYYNKPDLQFSYRKSVFSTLKNVIILRVDFKLQEGDSVERLQAVSQHIMQQRKDNQPLNYPSAGCVFKRINGVAVSKLIDEAGLKGFSVGGARVSEKHAGFVINQNGNATAKDVKAVLKHVKLVIKREHDLDLEEEIKFI